MSPPTLDVSLIVPAYREGPRLAASLRRALDACRAYFALFELIVVIDGPDGPTMAAVDEVRGDPLVRVCVNERNRGKGYSVRRGALGGAGPQRAVHRRRPLAPD